MDYKTHNLIYIENVGLDQNRYKCMNCNIYISIGLSGNFIFYSKDGSFSIGEKNIEDIKNLTCEEVQIKMLLE